VSQASNASFEIFGMLADPIRERTSLRSRRRPPQPTNRLGAVDTAKRGAHTIVMVNGSAMSSPMR
jgi:hypothetical protein